jgi:serine/threonine-protein kinase
MVPRIPTALRALLAKYVRQVSALSYGDLCEQQPPPWGSVPFGAAGLAYSLSRLGRTEAAQEWVAAASRACRVRRTTWQEKFGSADLGHSVYYNADGIELVRLLLQHSLGVGDDDAGRRHRFLDRCRAKLGGPPELLLGVGGYLTAAVRVHRVTGDERALRVADELADHLLSRARGRDGWTRAAVHNFAHGRAGTYFALLGWSQRTGRTLPSWFFGALRKSAGRARALSRGMPWLSAGDSAAAKRSWCNGAAGIVMLWARAFELTRDPLYLELARVGGRCMEQAATGARGDLCCGLGGRAYALLALDRVDPGRTWWSGAVRLAEGAAAQMLTVGTPWPNGLYRGYPGILCLVRDLESEPGDREGFPLVES